MRRSCASQPDGPGDLSRVARGAKAARAAGRDGSDPHATMAAVVAKINDLIAAERARGGRP